MASDDQRPNTPFILGIVFIAAGVALFAANKVIGIALAVVGGALLANGVTASRKAAGPGDGATK